MCVSTNVAVPATNTKAMIRNLRERKASLERESWFVAAKARMAEIKAERKQLGAKITKLREDGQVDEAEAMFESVEALSAECSQLKQGTAGIRAEIEEAARLIKLARDQSKLDAAKDGPRAERAPKTERVPRPLHVPLQLGPHDPLPDLHGMEAAGIGHGGGCGRTWLAGLKPFELPVSVEEQIEQLGHAMFLLFDAVNHCVRHDADLRTLLGYKVPARIPKVSDREDMLLIRPDIVVGRERNGSYKLTVTEIETCPASHGIIMACERGYGLSPRVVDEFVRFLDGKPYRVLFTWQWAEYLWDQAAFVAALRERGVDAEIWLDQPLGKIQEHAHKAWIAPQGTPASIRQEWDTDLAGRLQRLGFSEFVLGWDDLPRDVGNAVVFRFAYFDNLTECTIELLRRWSDCGATIMNPMQFWQESKVVMAAAPHPSVQDWIRERDAQAADLLLECLAETHLLAPCMVSPKKLKAERKHWALKNAGYDGGNKSWGARGVKLGKNLSKRVWRDDLESLQDAPYPVVAQAIAHSGRFDVGYVDFGGSMRKLLGGRTRLTPLLLRHGSACVNAGTLMTLRAGTDLVHGAYDAVITPVVFVE